MNTSGRQPAIFPNFLVGGAAKSATTSLAYYLGQHPDIFMAREKETHYFIFRASPFTYSGPGDRANFLPLVVGDADGYARCFEGRRTESAIGEASAYYLYQPWSLAQALDEIPNLKFVFILRHPIARAFSAFQHNRRDGLENCTSFGSALEVEDQRISQGWGFGWHYRHVSDYYSQFHELLRSVPRERLCIELYEDLASEPQSVLRRILHFLEVDVDFEPKTSVILNASGSPRVPGLNRLLYQPNRMKSAAKHVVPRRLGLSLRSRISKVNLDSQEMAGGDLRRASEMIDLDTDKLSALLDINFSVWDSEVDGIR